MGLALNIPQSEFIACEKPFRAFCGGYRSGKTFVGCVRIWSLALEYPGMKIGYFAPTFPHIRDIFYDTIQEVGEKLSDEWDIPLSCEINKSEHTVHLLVNGERYASVKCKSMSKPYSIVGFDISHALVDEIDCMKKADADAAWKKIVARMSSVRDDYKVNTVDFTTTPEGFNWIYDFFVKQLEKDPEKQEYYALVKASTLQNEKNLPDDYIDKLYQTYPANLVDAYVRAEFVNLKNGTVYKSYDPTLNASTEVVTDSDKAIYIGMDFNVTKMAARVFVKRGKTVHIVDEFNDLYDTPDMIEHVLMRYPDKTVYVYPDASGDARKPNSADVTDIKLLKSAGFRVRAKDANPRVKTRINSVNAMFCNGKGERRLFVNQERCPVTHDDLQQQVYNDKGELDKRGDADKHGLDAAGYYIVYEYPIKQPVSKHTIKFGGYQR